MNHIGDKIEDRTDVPTPAVDPRSFLLHTSIMSNNAEQPKVVPEDDDEPDEW
jgi:hypothetical protein